MPVSGQLSVAMTTAEGSQTDWVYSLLDEEGKILSQSYCDHAPPCTGGGAPMFAWVGESETFFIEVASEPGYSARPYPDYTLTIALDSSIDSLSP
jgi:hypothetical protein